MSRFSYLSESEESSEELEESKEDDDVKEESKDGEFDLSLAVQGQEEDTDDLTDELILFYYSVYKEAALEHYGKGKG